MNDELRVVTRLWQIVDQHCTVAVQFQAQRTARMAGHGADYDLRVVSLYCPNVKKICGLMSDRCV